MTAVTVQRDSAAAAVTPGSCDSYPGAGASGGRPSARVAAVASMFGLGLDDQRRVAVVPPTTIPLARGSVVFVTGPSGSGKSTLLRCLKEHLTPDADANNSTARPVVLDFAALPEADDAPLVDALDTPTLEDALRLLARAGLGDAFVMLRRPRELSDGQRYRFTLARLMAIVPPEVDLRNPGVPRAIVLADEFGATLDRLTAKVIARNVRKWATRTGVCAVLATTHDDLLEALDPDVLIEQHLGGRMTVLTRGDPVSTV